MLGYAPNISWVLPEIPFSDRLLAVARLGFEAIEFGFPSHADLDAIDACRQECGLRVVLFNQDVPAWGPANRGYLVDPRRRDDFWRTLDQALEIAGRLQVEKIQLPAGVVEPELARSVQRDCMLETLRAAAPIAAQAQVLLTIEVLNPDDNPGYFLTSSAEALDIVREVDHPHVRFQMDTYHLQRLEGHLVETLRANANWIGHLQFADYPGRHEPGTGEIDFTGLLDTAGNVGYRGYVGLEYSPLKAGPEALSWVPREMRAPGRATG